LVLGGGGGGGGGGPPPPGGGVGASFNEEAMSVGFFKNAYLLLLTSENVYGSIVQTVTNTRTVAGGGG
jgi:hypothetical protein